MSRPLRIEFKDAWYHVMNRGTARCAIFLNDTHREIFLNLLGQSAEMFGIEIHSYCLMDNHYHLLIRTPRANLSRAMRHIDGVYTQRFNRFERRDGSLFRGRYKAIIIDAENYLVALSRYIHRNPVEAKVCKLAADYQWSSYQSFHNPGQKPGWLITEEILNYIPPPKIQNYTELVENQLAPALRLYDFNERFRPIYGDKAFCEETTKKANHVIKNPEIPQARDRYGIPTISAIVDSTAQACGRPRELILKDKRKVANLHRNAAIYTARRKYFYQLTEIAAAFGFNSYSGVNSVVTKFEIALKTNKSTAELLEKIDEKLKNLP